MFHFQFQLGEDFSLIEGRAEVGWRRRQSEGPNKLPGMGVKFLQLDAASQKIVKAVVKRKAAKVGRNDPCPCGSGKKFKLCHGSS